MRILIALLLVATAFAGCADDAADKVDESLDASWEFVNPAVLEHDHGDISVHDIVNRMDLVGHHYLGDDGPPGSISEIDVVWPHAYLGVMGYGFIIMDISNASAPELVASVEITHPDNMLPIGLYMADLKVDASGDWVFVATELSTTPGVLIYDARDRENPTLAGFWPEPGLLLGCHMIEYAKINEGEYLFCAPLDNAVYVGRILPPVGATREIVQVARWVPNHPKFIEQEAAWLQRDPIGFVVGQASFHQDMTFQVDPLTQTPMLTVSFWNLGTRFVDVSIPEVPLEVGSWMGEGSSLYDGVIHTAMMWKHGERRIHAAIPEGADPPALFILDTTDLSDPIVLAEWTAHDDFKGEAGRFSMHNFQVVDGKIYLAMYHGGIWVFDVSTDEYLEAPDPVASYLTHMPRKDGQSYAASPWDVVVANGYVITAEGNAGFYVLNVHGDTPGDEDITSFA